MADAILDYVTGKGGGVSFVELERNIGGFGGGTYEIGLLEKNLVCWRGLTRKGFEAVALLQRLNLIHLLPTNLLIYLCDGKLLRLPVAERPVPYKKPHWVPCVLNPGPYLG